MATARALDYQDLDLDFIAHPVRKDIVKKTGPDAVARAIRNLVLTNFYDGPFRPYIGSNAQKLLFENINGMTANHLQNAISEVVNNFEPRASLIGVRVVAQPDRNGYYAKIAFTVNNRPEPYGINVFLERVR